MKIVMVIPTYNEMENTERMIKALSKTFARIPNHRMNVLYVDANSPDGTAEVIRRHQERYPWLHLLVESKKEGMGRAYAKGMTYAMKDLRADYLMEFDGDFQHRPEDIPLLVAKIDEGYDYIIGSRYVKGGSIPREWGWDRKALSVIGNLFARAALLKRGIHDVTGGLRISKVKGFMDRFDFDKLLSKRFAYKVHLLYFMLESGARYVEVPIKFEHRTLGDSKIIKNDLLETLRVIFLLQLQNTKLIRFFKFGLVGGFGLLLQTLVFEIVGIHFKLLSPSVAAAAGGELAIVNNFIFNNMWTFKEFRVTGSRVLVKFIQFNLTSLISLFVQYIILRVGETVSRGSNLIIQTFYFGAIIIVLIINYTVYNLFIWKTSSKN